MSVRYKPKEDVPITSFERQQQRARAERFVTIKQTTAGQEFIKYLEDRRDELAEDLMRNLNSTDVAMMAERQGRWRECDEMIRYLSQDIQPIEETGGEV